MKQNICFLSDGIDHVIDWTNHAEFYFNYQKGIFLALLKKGKLTQHQYEQCCKKLAQQYKK